MSWNRKTLFLCLFFLSGISALIYEIVWGRLLVFVFGGTTFAITTVLACFMGGLAVGGWLGGRLASRVSRLERAYGVIEISIGVFCLSTPFLFGAALPAYKLLISALGESSLLITLARVLVSFLVLLVPTALMGATLPVLARAFARSSGRVGGDVGRLYGINTLGAFLGAAAAGFLLLPSIGLYNSILLASSLNVLAGVSALFLSVSAPLETTSAAPGALAAPAPPPLPARPMDGRLLLFLYALSGFAALAYQVAWTRALILSLGASTYAFSAVVASFIFGLALGSLLLSAWADRLSRPLRAAGFLEVAIGLSALLVVPLFGMMPELVQDLSQRTGADFGSVFPFEAACVFGLLLVPTTAMGALMPLVCRLYDPSPAHAGRAVGNVYAANTAGTIAGALAAGFLLIPSAHVGMQRTIVLMSFLSLTIGTVFLAREGKASRPRTYAFIIAPWAVAVLMASVISPWSKERMVSGPFLGRSTPGYEVLYYREDADTTVGVRYYPDSGVRSLTVNGKPDASNAMGDMYTQYLLAHIPLLLRPDSKDVCVIGLGSGGTTGAALAFPIRRVDVAELSESVIEASDYFLDISGNALADPRVRVHREDGRNFLMLTDMKYDVIISEPPNVWMRGVSNLFTREFFEIARSRLRPGGIHAQWVHGYGLKSDDFASILRTINEVFGHVQVWEMAIGDYLVLGSDRMPELDMEGLYFSFARGPVAEVLSRIYITDPMQLANHYVAEGEYLAEWFKRAPILTDGRPRLEFSSPRRLLTEDIYLIEEALYGSKVAPRLKASGAAPLEAAFIRAVEASRKSRAFYARAWSAIEWGEVEGFRREFVDAVRLAPDDARMIAYWMGQVYGLVGREDIYKKMSNEIAEFVPDVGVLGRRKTGGLGPSLHRPFGKAPAAAPGAEQAASEIVRLMRSGRSSEALGRARAALGPSPYNPALLLLAGGLAAELEGPGAALPYLLRAWLISPTDPAVRGELAKAYSQMEDEEKAGFFTRAFY